MNKPAIYTIVSFLLLASGCAVPYHTVTLRIRSDPMGAALLEKGREVDPSAALAYNNKYAHMVSRADLKKGFIEWPEFAVIKPGYVKSYIKPEATILDQSFRRAEMLTRDFGVPSKYHTVDHANTIILQRLSDYEGPKFNKNKIKLTINSEPQGARIYSEGKFCGVTPLTMELEIDNKAYKTGSMQIAPLVAAHDTCLPVRQDLQFQVDPDWRYEGGVTHDYATLFLLKRDPDYQPPVVVQGQAPRQGNLNVTVKKDKDALDLLQQFGQVGIIIRSLQPIR